MLLESPALWGTALESRALWGTAPPEPRSRITNWPTVLFSWWCTAFSAVIIITRLCSRKVRSNKLFREDYIMMLAIIPLFLRMILVHFVLIYGTNNIDTTTYDYTPLQLHRKSIGASLVLPARIFYAMFIWASKLTVSEFLKRITFRIWRKSHQRTLQGIRAFLCLTFAAVVIATLAECQPFTHYWQVLPDPGPHCRQGYAQLLVMGTCDIVTDVLLIAFPIPVVLTSGVNWKRKLQMVLLFSLSLIMIGVTAARIPEVINKHGRQQYRTVWASCEILAATAVSNAVILGSMLRDKGTKKNKFRSYSITESIDRNSARRPTLVRYQTTESDEDLFFELGCRVPEHLRRDSVTAPRPAPPALPAKEPIGPPCREDTPLAERQGSHVSTDSEESLKLPIQHRAPVQQVLPSPAPSATRSISFFDVGNLLDGQERPTASNFNVAAPLSSPGGVAAHDFASESAEERTSRSGSRAFLRDVGGIFSPNSIRNGSGSPRRSRETQRGPTRHRTPPAGVLAPMLERSETQMSLQDAGGLLGDARSQAYVLGAVSQDASLPDPPAAQSVPSPFSISRPARQRRSRDGIELEDISEVLREGRQPDVGIRCPHGPRERGQRDSTRSASPPSFDDMVLNDAGGLMGR
ncbi:hypothetical protein AC579_5573 [Pseudocercospora musae]|uniref:Rhodopsin domain-containing protein n=1 Tax=Pseudocercospora musae TaxID=113226 RepID=A0A139IP93_9PEZI|nr:hypothetical protein AC579_5573 [Pseudocercospora musae]KXT16361.1 hypothetical protein AC579_5573 [Pseudocercospora musae]KXT16364.1 hypothetical protein AC579_5573 [Pseudocercospora musae]KXT16365.1 hypothetical protein AC579_5573 [Pseudocercospora musae]KXT16366.1 hypothetical protein AC579_5573 [Pseudocercospora musae]